jgi:hypothetical protein
VVAAEGLAGRRLDRGIERREAADAVCKFTLFMIPATGVACLLTAHACRFESGSNVIAVRTSCVVVSAEAGPERDGSKEGQAPAPWRLHQRQWISFSLSLGLKAAGVTRFIDATSDWESRALCSDGGCALPPTYPMQTRSSQAHDPQPTPPVEDDDDDDEDDKAKPGSGGGNIDPDDDEGFSDDDEDNDDDETMWSV